MGFYSYCYFCYYYSRSYCYYSFFYYSNANYLSISSYCSCMILACSISSSLILSSLIFSSYSLNSMALLIISSSSSNSLFYCASIIMDILIASSISSCSLALKLLGVLWDYAVTDCFSALFCASNNRIDYWYSFLSMILSASSFRSPFLLAISLLNAMKSSTAMIWFTMLW